jgi:hypothetical protein
MVLRWRASAASVSRIDALTERHRRGSSDLSCAADAPAVGISVETWERLKIATGRAKDLEQLDRFHGDR